MKVALDISVPSGLWRGLPRARALARETIIAAVSNPERMRSALTALARMPSAP